MKYEIVPTKADKNWDDFIEASPQGTIFSHSDYLNALGKEYSLFYVYTGREICAALALVLSENRDGYALDDLVIYNGIMYSKKLSERKLTSRYSEQFRIAEYIIEQLGRKNSKIEMALSPYYEDMRPFLWYNYHAENVRHKFSIDLRYTCYLDIQGLANESFEEELNEFRELEELRRRNVRQARRAEVVLVEEERIFELLLFYKENLIRQGQIVSETKLQRMQIIIERLLLQKKAHIFAVKTNKNEVAVVNVYVYDKKRAYYLFGAGNSEIREHYCGTIAFWDAFKVLAKHGITEVDMEGVNSPKRGQFKMGFGGRLIPYYQVYLG